MGYFIAFGLVYIGYSLVDWGHFVLKHEKVSLWYLMSGMGSKTGDMSTSSSSTLDVPQPIKGRTLIPSSYNKLRDNSPWINSRMDA